MMSILEKYWFIALLVGAVFCLLAALSLYKFFAFLQDRKLKELQQIETQKRAFEDSTLDAFDEEEKDAFKKDIVLQLNYNLHKNRSQLKKEMMREVLYAQSRQYEKLKRAALIKIIRKVLHEFRSRFFQNLRQALIAKAQKKKGPKAKLSRMQESAIQEVEEEIQTNEDRKEQREKQREAERKRAEKERSQKEKEAQLEQEKEIARLREEEERARSEQEKERLRQERLKKEKELKEQQERQAQQQAQQRAAQQRAAQQMANTTRGGQGRSSGGR